MIIVRKSNKNAYLLTNGLLVLLHPSGWQSEKLPVITVDDLTWANLVTAYGNPVGT